MMFKPASLPTINSALKGREEAIRLQSTRHFVNGNDITPPWPKGLHQAMFGLGCFWGAERIFWQLPGVWVTAVGYSAGITPNPTYDEVCSGQTGHNEVVLVVFDAQECAYLSLLQTFWQSHNPTQLMQQGNDVGTQYRSEIYTLGAEQNEIAASSLHTYQVALNENKKGSIVTKIKAASQFYYAEQYHQQYLAKNPSGYCGLGGVGVDFFV